MRALRADLWLAVTIIVVAAIYLHADYGLRAAKLSDPLGPKAFPALVGGGLILSALLLLLETWTKRRALTDLRTEPRGKDQAHLVLSLVAMVVWTAIYYFVFERLGYLIATPLFLLGLLSFFHKGHHVTNLLVAFGFTAAVYLLFSILLGVPLPTGPFDL
jgi:putative tricarboxylic transport membrane protein